VREIDNDKLWWNNLGREDERRGIVLRRIENATVAFVGGDRKRYLLESSSPRYLRSDPGCITIISVKDRLHPDGTWPTTT